MEKTRVEARVARHEGFMPHLYRCPRGKLTIGYGCNLQAGMSEEEAHLLMRHRIGKIAASLDRALPWYKDLSPERKEALIDMAYQLGVGGLLKFTNMLAAIARGDWESAAAELLDSEMAREDSPDRAKENAAIIRGA